MKEKGLNLLSAIAVLKAEHELIKTMLGSLCNLCARLENGGKVEASSLATVLAFISEFADRLHHGKEEDILFGRMERLQLTEQDDMIGALLAEHTLGRSLVSQMADESELFAKGDPDAAANFAESSRAFIALLVQHICKEDKVFFVAVDEHLSAGDQDELTGQFERFDAEISSEQVWEKHKQIVDRLSTEFGVSAQIAEICG